MKKVILFFMMIFTLCTTLAFADKSRFYQNGKVIDTMYVDSAEGLRVRDKPSLKSNRICGLTHRAPVKIIAVGREDTIDGITAPWVEILIPRYEWKGEEPEFGWVFGGYLEEKCPDFVEPKNAGELADYLSGFMSWAFYDKHGEAIGFMHFYKDGTFYEFHPSPVDPGYDSSFGGGENLYGTWKALSAKSFSVSAKNQVTGESRTRTVKLDYIYDVYWAEAHSSDTGASVFSPKPIEGNAYHEIKTIRDGSILQTKGAYVSAYWGGFRLYDTYYYDENYRPSEELVMKYIKAGINVDRYDENRFASYWTPIMAEHQKKADAMK